MSSIELSAMLELFARIVLASLCGAIIGIERSRRFKEAGIRTHCVVAFGSALMMVVSKYGFADIASGSSLMAAGRLPDPSRIAAQVVTGVGFLGAGVIFRTGVSVKGLTTAAGIWATSAVGLALGSGMYEIGALATALMLALQYVMHRFQVGTDTVVSQEIEITTGDADDGRREFFDFVERRGGVIASCATRRRKNGELSYRVVVRGPVAITPREMQELMSSDCGIRGYSV